VQAPLTKGDKVWVKPPECYDGMDGVHYHDSTTVLGKGHLWQQTFFDEKGTIAKVNEHKYEVTLTNIELDSPTVTLTNIKRERLRLIPNTKRTKAQKKHQSPKLL
jgi:hypothetical protein